MNHKYETDFTTRFSSIIQNNKRKTLVVLFGVAFAFRTVVLLSLNDWYLLTPDGFDYHNMAVNFVRGNGLSNNISPPYHPTFFREPAYPAFLASGYKLWALCGGKLSLIDWRNPQIYDFETKEVAHEFTEIRFIKFYQAFFDSFSILFLFLILRLVLPLNLSFIIAMAYAVFWPIATHCNYILRESFQTLVLLIMNYFFIKALLSDKKRYYILFALFWTISNLTLQITLIPLVVFVFFLIWQSKKSIHQAFLKTALAFVFMIFFMSPWFLYAYHYYPDIRIAKTGGCSLTYEWIDWKSHQYKLIDVMAEKNKKLTRDDVIKIENMIIIDKNDFSNFTESFEKSFDGYFKSQVDSMKIILSSVNHQGNWCQRFVPKAEKFGKHALLNFWVKRKWDMNKSYYENLREKNIFPILIYGFSIIWGGLSFVGFIIGYRKLLPVLLVFFFFWSLSYFIGNETRRLLPAYPYVFTFGIVGAKWLLKTLTHFMKKTVNQVKDSDRGTPATFFIGE